MYKLVFLLVFLVRVVVPGPAKVELSVTGLPDNSCVTTDPYNGQKTCNYTYSDPALIGTTIPLQCILAGQVLDDFILAFGRVSRYTESTISREIFLTGKNETEVCQAYEGNGNIFTVDVHIYYMPLPLTTVTTTEHSTSNSYDMSTEVGPQTSIATCPVVTWVFWFATGIGVVLFFALVITITKCREIAKNLEETENELRQIEARETEMAILAHRPVMKPPPEIVYDRVYAHGAGLMRKPF